MIDISAEEPKPADSGNTKTEAEKTESRWVIISKVSNKKWEKVEYEVIEKTYWDQLTQSADDKLDHFIHSLD